MPYKPDLKKGRRFGKLVVIKKTSKLIKTTSSCYLCICDCGAEKIVPRNCLISKAYKSCGCSRIKSKPPGHSAKIKLYNICRSNAKTRNIPFNLTTKEHYELISGNCYYCDSKPFQYNPYVTKNGKIRNKLKGYIKTDTVKRALIKANSVDRLNSKFGYTKKNCVSSCWICNKMKSDLPLNDFLNKIRDIFYFKCKNKEPYENMV